MKDILNARIKHREAFRPFAPSVLLEHTGEYLDQSRPDPFVIKVYSVLPEMRSVISAVTHVDGTGRLQTVSREYSPLYWKLIEGIAGIHLERRYDFSAPQGSAGGTATIP